MTHSDITKFQAYIYRFFESEGRHHLPWRLDYEPYKIMISEIMLQQTQVDRVIPKFNDFLKAFPTVHELAEAPVAQVITHWQGLGYNRRGLNLQRAAQKIVKDFKSQVPSDTEALLSLPGIGPYTAAAIQAFAFNIPSIVIETNVRAVFIFHFFLGHEKVSDEELLPLIKQTLDSSNPRRWYSALMDYGTYLKRNSPNPTRKSQKYTKQSPLVGSNREVRGRILKVLTENPSVSVSELPILTGIESTRLETALPQLVKEGFITYQADTLTLKH